MAHSRVPDREIVAFDGGELADRSNVRALLDRVVRGSPRALLTEEHIRELAHKLDSRRRPGMATITVARLAMRLRRVTRSAVDVLAGSLEPIAAGFEPAGELGGTETTTRLLPDSSTANAAKVARAAKRKLRSATSAIDKCKKCLMSSEVAAFATFDTTVMKLLHDELARIQDLVRPQYGFTRGHPPLAQVIRELRKIYSSLVGWSLREWDDVENADRFLSDALNKVVRKLTPIQILDEEIGRTIESVIKSPR